MQRLETACKVQVDFLAANTPLHMPSPEAVAKTARILAPPTVTDRKGQRGEPGQLERPARMVGAAAPAGSRRSVVARVTAMRAMRVCVFGAGAVGGNIAVMLARAGADVSVLVRGATLQAVRARGFELHTPDGVVRANVHCASDDPRELGEQDAVLVTVKQTALTASAPAITALLGRDTPAVFLGTASRGGTSTGRECGRRQADSRARPGDVLWNTVGPQRGRRRHVEPARWSNLAW